MTLAEPVQAQPVQNLHHGLVRPTQLIAQWVRIWANGGAETQDGSGTITDPDADILDPLKSIYKIAKVGTKLRLRLKYDDGITDSPPFSTDLVLHVFGRFGTDPWQRLVNLCGNAAIIMTGDEAGSAESLTDVTDAVDMYTHPHPSKHTLDLDGCDQILAGCITPLVAGTGDATLVSLWAKAI